MWQPKENPKFASYDGGEQPEVSAEPQVVEEHGPALSVTVRHSEGTHKLHSMHKDGYSHESDHRSADEAYDSAKKLARESGGVDQARDEKKMSHKPQQSSASQEENFSMPDLA
jgi:hypothetical protein